MKSSSYSGFFKLSVEERMKEVAEFCTLTPEEQAILKEAGVDSAVFGKAEPTPRTPTWWRGRPSTMRIDVTVSSPSGGGSSHDCAKALPGG